MALAGALLGRFQVHGPGLLDVRELVTGFVTAPRVQHRTGRGELDDQRHRSQQGKCENAQECCTEHHVLDLLEGLVSAAEGRARQTGQERPVGVADRSADHGGKGDMLGTQLMFPRVRIPLLARIPSQGQPY